MAESVAFSKTSDRAVIYGEIVPQMDSLIAPESDLVADLGFDSLQVLDVIAELEAQFDVIIPLDRVPAARTVEQVVAEVTRLVERRAAE